MPAYNADRYISDSIESVQVQTFSNWELLIINDCSTDNTKNLIEDFAKTDSRIRCIHLSHNSGGPAKPRNIGIKYSIGSWVAFIDADDIWLKEKLEIQVKKLKHLNISLLCSNITDFKKTSKANSPFNLIPNTYKSFPISYFRLLFKNIIPTSSVICKKKSILEVGGFNEDKNLIAVEDYDLWLRLLNHNFKIYKICIPLVNYRLSYQGISRNKFVMFKKILSLLINRIKKDNPSLAILFPFCIAYYIISSLLRIFFNKKL